VRCLRFEGFPHRRQGGQRRERDEEMPELRDTLSKLFQLRLNVLTLLNDEVGRRVGGVLT